MGLTPHGIKYPEMADLPNVPSDIGGILKLNQTAQAWLATLDTTNLASLSAMNSSCAAAEASVAGVEANITTAVNRQAGQQTSVSAIKTRNDNVNSRLNTRDTTLAADNSTVNGFGGLITALSSSKGRGLISGNLYNDSVNVPCAGNAVYHSFTFNDPSPSAQRMYRAFFQVNLTSVLSSSYYAVIGMTWASGTTFSGSWTQTNFVGLSGTNYPYGAVTLEAVFTGISASQWTLWVGGQGPAGSGTAFTMGGYYSVLTLEDIGLQL